MAKILNPLHSLAVSGSIKGGLSFRQTKNGSVLARTPAPYKQTSPAQIANQQKMLDALAAFKNLSVEDKALWQTLADTRRRSAWTCFFAEYHYQNIDPPNEPLIPEAIL